MRNFLYGCGQIANHNRTVYHVLRKEAHRLIYTLSEGELSLLGQVGGLVDGEHRTDDP